jgi:chemotaxis response regulator CheB
MQKTSVMIINDSRAMRLFLEDVVKSLADCEISGSYFDGNVALESLKSKKPDVIILDLEMPNLDGLTFLERLPSNEKFPTIVVSNYAKEGSEMINQAMVLGAIDSLIPPASNTKEEFEKFRTVLHHKITMASLKSSKFTLKC